jgi:pimeloyl-ACP methyl ester carboxylesterase
LIPSQSIIPEATAERIVLRGLVSTPYGYVHFRHAGSAHARAVVVSHISQQSSALMLELLEALAPKVHAIAFDYPSCGMSDHVLEQPAIEDYAGCALAVLDALGVQRAAALGEATGAFVSAELAATAPERIERAILVNCPYYPDRSVHERAHAPLRDRLRPADPSGFPVTRTLEFVLEQDPAHAPVNADQSWMDRINVAQMEAGRERWQALQALAGYDLLTRLGEVRVPVHCLMGEQFHYRKDLDALAAHAKDATTEVIAGARFCVTWSHAALIASRAFGYMGL